VTEERNWQLDGDERKLVRRMTEFPEVLEKAVEECMPHHICTYLYELAQTFNSFYEHNRVIDDPRQEYRLLVVSAYAGILRNGLELLNIPAPERM
jgi:arginyl-tRNA synthetase